MKREPYETNAHEVTRLPHAELNLRIAETVEYTLYEEIRKATNIPGQVFGFINGLRFMDEIRR